MSKPVNDIVSKEWTTQAMILLAGSYKDITSLFTRLLTLQGQEEQRLKSKAARDRIQIATQATIEWIKYGWSFGFSDRPMPIKNRPVPPLWASTRFESVLRVAHATGYDIGRNQMIRIDLAHKIPRPGTSSLEAEQKGSAKPSATSPT